MIETLRIPAVVTHVEPWTFDAEAARRALIEQLQAQSLAGYGLEGHPAAVSAFCRTRAWKSASGEASTSATSASTPNRRDGQARSSRAIW